LSNRLNKSKPALYHHLQKMIDLGLVEVSREKKVRGSIKAKYYCLSGNTIQKMRPIATIEQLKKITNPKEQLAALKNLSTAYKNAISLFRSSLGMVDHYLDYLEEETLAEEAKQTSNLDFQKIIFDYGLGIDLLLWNFFTEEQFEKALAYYREFFLKIEKLMAEETSKGEQKKQRPPEHPYFVLTMIMPLNKLLELLSISKNNGTL
jgi:DNA-binding transcriptional ArsR family regulator